LLDPLQKLGVSSLPLQRRRDYLLLELRELYLESLLEPVQLLQPCLLLLNDLIPDLCDLLVNHQHQLPLHLLP